MQILKWTNGHILKDRIGNDDIRKGLDIAYKGYDAIESLRSFGHVQQRSVAEPIRKIER